MKGWLMLLGAGGLIVGVVFAEIGARLFFRDGVPFLVQSGSPDDQLERRPRGSVQRTVYGTFTYDDDGFRIGSGLPYDYSVLFIGDSFTEGFGVGDDDTFARATERALRRDGLAVRSLNAGNRGFGAAQELKVLRRVLAHMRIDAIVMQSFPMNDFSDNLAHGGFGIENDRLVEYETPVPPWSVRLGAAIGESWLQELYVVRLAANATLNTGSPAPFDSSDSFALERALLNEIVSTAQSHDVAIVALLVPTTLTQNNADENALPPLHAAEVRRFTSVRTWVQAAKVPYVDAGQVICRRRQSRRRPLFR
jgi:hypothetical protein